jgi:hypothetical protein
VKELQKRQALLAFKSSADHPPPGSGLAFNLFMLIIQTEYQRKMFLEHGNAFVGIDATHNVSHYENLSLFTIIVRDKWGHGEQLTK